MKYVLLIYDDEKTWQNMTPEESNAIMGEYFQFTKSIQDAGKYKAGEALHPVSTATTVRVRGGKVQTTDGPFAETREALGGFYLVDAENLDEAIAIAARIPSARLGSIEVRPVVVFDRPEASLPTTEAGATVPR